jgi:MFS family permease
MFRNRNVQLYLLVSFLSNVGMNIFGPIYIIYVAKYVDPALILIPNLVFFATKTIAEYPTGFIADKFGKKLSTSVGLFLLAFTPIIYGFSTGMIGFVIAEFIGAIGFSLISGALDEWLQEKTTPEITTKTQSVSDISGRVGTTIAVGLLGIFYIPNLSIYWFVSGVMVLIAFAVSLALSKDKIEWHHENNFIAMKSHWSEFISNQKLVRMTSYESLRYVVEGAGIFMFWSLFFTQVRGMSVAEMFYVFAIINLGMMAGNLVALKAGLSKSISYTNLLFLKGIVLALMLVVPNWYAVAFFFVFEFMESVMRVKFNDFLNHQVNGSKNGSSVRSLSFFVTGLGRAVGMATMGLVAKWLGINGLWLFAAIILILLALSRIKGLPRFARNDTVKS